VLLLAQKQCCVSSMDRYRPTLYHAIHIRGVGAHTRGPCSSARPCTSRMRNIVLWGEQEAQHSPVVPLGFSEFLTRVRAHNQDQSHQNAVRIDQAAAFYNRQSIVQIFFRIPASQHKAPTVKIDDPDGEFPNRKSVSSMYVYPDLKCLSRRCSSTPSFYRILKPLNDEGENCKETGS
jgi:hypothetical protein